MDMRYSLQQQRDDARDRAAEHLERILEDRLGVQFAPRHDVLVHQPDGHTRITSAPGWTPSHAEDTARWDAGHSSDVTYLAAEPDESALPVPDWWADAPAADGGDVDVR